MQAVRAPNTEPIPGYRLLEPLGRGGFGEVWKCEAPGGQDTLQLKILQWQGRLAVEAHSAVGTVQRGPGGRTNVGTLPTNPEVRQLELTLPTG